MFIQSRNRGFTLNELMITVAIVGVLASVVYPSYVDFVSRSNRSEGQRELLRIANLQEQFFVDNRAYTEVMTNLGLSADPFITENGHYNIDAKVVNGSFTLTATAVSSQKVNDSDCLTLTITDTGKKSSSPEECWEQ